jgi:hypothetical protein
MKHFKFLKVDAVTGISSQLNEAKNGAVHPALPGLQILWERNWLFASADDGAIGNADNFVIELSDAEFAAEVQNELALRKTDHKRQVSAIEKMIRDKVTERFHPSELAAAPFKVTQAEKAIDAIDEDTARSEAPMLAIEADARGVSVKDMADIVMANYSNLMMMEGMVSGASGKKMDLIDSIAFDAVNPMGCLNEFGVLIDRGNVDIMGNPIIEPKYNVNNDWPVL